MKITSTNKFKPGKLASYSAMAGAFIAVNTSANGQVLYTDVNPDETYSENGEFYELDLNLDGDVDFALKVLDFSTAGVFNSAGGATWGGLIQAVVIYSYNGAVGGSATYALPYALNSGVAVDSDMNFNTNATYGTQVMALYLGIQDYYGSGGTLAWFTSPVGEWEGKTEKFLGLRLEDGGADYYGWARVSVDDNAHEFTIHDFAVKQSSDNGIETGATVGVISVIQNNELTAYSYGSTINVVVKDLQTTGATVKVFNLEGQVVYQNELNMSGMQIDLENMATGVYTLQVVTAENAAYSKKLSIQ
jgi:hypothetical protein